MEVKKVICPNCGASIYENAPACPFCGYINISGAEEKFMQDIKKTEQDMSHIPELQKAEYKKTISKSSRIIFITIGITAVVLAVIVGFPYFMEEVVFGGSERDAKAQMVWNNENYPILNEMFEEGDYEGILEFENELWDQNAENKTDFYLYDWEHYDFMNGYRYYIGVKEYLAELDNGEELSIFGKENLVYYCMWFYYRQYDKERTYMTYTDEEIEVLDGFREYTNEVLFDRLGFSQKEADELIENAVDEYEYLKAKKCYDYGKKVGDRFQ